MLAASGVTSSSGLPLEPDLADPTPAALYQVVETPPVPVVAALRWVAKVERRAAAMPAVFSRVRPPEPERIALHGAAPELVTLARLALARGLGVVWHHSGPPHYCWTV